MNEEEREDIELDIEAKYVDKTEKEFLNRVTYAECLYILTPKNKYCDKIKELSVLKICEIIEKLQKENEKLKSQEATAKKINELLVQRYSNSIPTQKVKDKIEELNSRIEIYRKYVEQGVETNVEWVDNVADRETVKVLQELIEERRKK